MPVNPIHERHILMSEETRYLREAIALARANVDQGGRPFGAVVVRDGAVIATGVNDILATNDPTAHAELTALRAASRQLGSPDLSGCVVYASGHPCPMCLALLISANANKVFFAFDNDDAQPYQLSSEGTYQRLGITLKPLPLPIERVETGITAAQLYGDAAWPAA